MLRHMVMRAWAATALVCALLPLSACGGGSGQAVATSELKRPRAGDPVSAEGPPRNWLSKPPYADGAAVGKSYDDYWLHTHCSVNGARLDGSWWDATNGSARRDGWAEPYQQGTMRMTSEDTAVFTFGEQSVEFVRTQATDYPPCA
jgi:hypothetical protein